MYKRKGKGRKGRELNGNDEYELSPKKNKRKECDLEGDVTCVLSTVHSLCCGWKREDWKTEKKKKKREQTTHDLNSPNNNHMSGHNHHEFYHENLHHVVNR